MNGQPALLDVNIPMYAAGQPHPLKEACVWIMTEIAYGRLDVAIDTEIIQEVLYRYGALRRWEIGVTMARNLLDLVPTVFPVSVAEMKTAVSLFSQYAPQGVKARDLLHTAVMQHNNLTHIISADTHFNQIEGITRLDPQMLYQQAQIS